MKWCLVHLGVTVPPGPRCPPQRSAQVGQENLYLRRSFGTLEGRLGRQTGPSPGWPGSCITFSRASLPVGHGGTHLPGAEPSGLLTHVTLQTVGSLSCRDGVPSLGAHPSPGTPQRGRVRWETRELPSGLGGSVGHQARPPVIGLKPPGPGGSPLTPGGSGARGCALLCDIGQVLASLASRAPPARGGPRETPALHPQFMSPEMAGPIWGPFPLLRWPLARKQGSFVVPAAAEPLGPSGAGRLSRPLPQGALGGWWTAPGRGAASVLSLMWDLEGLRGDKG